MSNYLSQHWQGKHSLLHTLALNTITVTIVMVFTLSKLTQWVELKHWLSDQAILVCLSLFWLSVVCWQVVGVFRVASKRIANYGSVYNYYLALGVVLICASYAFSSIATQVGKDIDYRQQVVDAYTPPTTAFTLQAIDATHISLTGEIDFGASRQLRALLNQSQAVQTILLNSTGGLIVEARGLANIAKQHGLNTQVDTVCYSACTIVFIAGDNRTMAEDAVLGFHQYHVQTTTPLPWISTPDEQVKDLHYFQEKNVAPWFLEQMYNTPHQQIWTPSINTLLQAGIITDAP